MGHFTNCQAAHITALPGERESPRAFVSQKEGLGLMASPVILNFLGCIWAEFLKKF
jgi:hypothetical protein